MSAWMSTVTVTSSRELDSGVLSFDDHVGSDSEPGRGEGLRSHGGRVPGGRVSRPLSRWLPSCSPLCFLFPPRSEPSRSKPGDPPPTARGSDSPCHIPTRPPALPGARPAAPKRWLRSTGEVRPDSEPPVSVPHAHHPGRLDGLSHLQKTPSRFDSSAVPETGSSPS